MISNKVKYYCKDDISKIKNYEQAINDKENMWDCHHIWEISLDGEHELHTKDELIRMEMYYNRPYYELIFVTKSEHKKLHFGTNENRDKVIKRNTGRTISEFGKKYKEHYGYGRLENIQQYKNEWKWYNKHNNKCRWEN